jgi:single-stranded DNA-binding protein
VLEKDALSGVVMPVTSKYDVPLMVARGYASLSFLHSAADFIKRLDVPTWIYHFGDFDPSGVNAGEKIKETLIEMALAAEIHFERVAVTAEQIGDWNLPTRPTKTSDTRSRNFGNISVELDAIDPSRLRGLVMEVIERHLPPDRRTRRRSRPQRCRAMIRASIHGRLGADPLPRETRTGKTMVTANIAVDVAKPGEEAATEWFSLAAFGRAAETLAQHSKGDLISAMGSLTRSSFTGRDGQERTSWSLLAASLLSARTVYDRPVDSVAPTRRRRAPARRGPPHTSLRRSDVAGPALVDDPIDDLWRGEP